ncbi:MAG TPA: M28 family peptidase [Gemmatimonadaceae bacterium]|nr:M28 family peptidase [Gemmatimonadaceae bacterium]
MPAADRDAGPGPSLLHALAVRGRFTGSEALAEARRLCAEQLRLLGFAVTEHQFEYSTVPARFGMPAVGTASVVLLGGVVLVAQRTGAAPASVLAAVSLAAIAGLARWLTGASAIALPAARAAGVNLQAVRGVEPRVWLVAHLDSKSQRYPLALRAVGASLTIGAWVAMLLLIMLAGAGHGWPHAWWVWGAGAAGGALLGLGSAGNDSPGAVDNASGVAAVLAASARLAPDVPVGVLITDAEEVGLAGAHAWARHRTPGTAVNCDTIDDRGAFLLLTSGRRPRRVAAAAVRAAGHTGIAVRARPLPRGVLTDGVALARAGWACATLSRATARTLLRIHTRRDSVGHLEGSGIAPAAVLLESLVKELC